MSEPTLRPTDPATLVVGGLAAAAVAWLLISRFYQDLPPIGWPPVILIAGLAVFGAVLAQYLWTRIHTRGGLRPPRSPRTPSLPGPAVVGRRRGGPPEPVEPLAVARFAVLAKATSLAGAILAGGYAGFVPWLAIESGRVAGAATGLPPAVGGLVASAGLMAAALWLERACRVPAEPDEDGDPDPGPPDAT